MSNQSRQRIELQLLTADERDTIGVLAHAERYGGAFLSQVPNGERGQTIVCEFPDMDSVNDFAVWISNSPINVGPMRIYEVNHETGEK